MNLILFPAHTCLLARRPRPFGLPPRRQPPHTPPNPQTPSYQMEEDYGLWPLPPPEHQPRTLAELNQTIRNYLHVGGSSYGQRRGGQPSPSALSL